MTRVRRFLLVASLSKRKRNKKKGKKKKSIPDISEKIEAEMMWLFSHVAAEAGGEKAARHNTHS